MDAQGVAAQAAGGTDALSGADEQALVEALARSAVQDAAPEELPLFAPTSEAYFDPKRGTPAGAKSDEMLGFGVDAAAAMVFVTPVALEAARSVVSYLVAELQAALKDESKPMIQALVHRLAHLRDKPGRRRTPSRRTRSRLTRSPPRPSPPRSPRRSSRRCTRSPSAPRSGWAWSMPRRRWWPTRSWAPWPSDPSPGSPARRDGRHHAPQSVRVPVRHDVPLPAADRRDRRRQPARLRLALRPVRRPPCRGGRPHRLRRRPPDGPVAGCDRRAAGGLPIVPCGRQRHAPRCGPARHGRARHRGWRRVRASRWSGCDGATASSIAPTRPSWWRRSTRSRVRWASSRLQASDGSRSTGGRSGSRSASRATASSR